MLPLRALGAFFPCTIDANPLQDECVRFRPPEDDAVRGLPGDEGALLHPPDYQKLEGDWKDGEDPAKRA